MSDTDVNSQASNSAQGAQSLAASPQVAGQADPTYSANNTPGPSVPPVVLTLAQIKALQADPSLSAEQEPTVGLTDATLQGY